MKEMTPKMEAPVNAKHKDTVFRMLYSNKETLLELYNALNGTDYRTVENLEITTLENAVYLSMKNDVSFLLDAKMMLYEHQSTWNPNMPLRDLFYIARLMEKYVIKDSLYSSTLTKIPAPHFITLKQYFPGSQKSADYPPPHIFSGVLSGSAERLMRQLQALPSQALLTF